MEKQRLEETKETVENCGDYWRCMQMPQCMEKQRDWRRQRLWRPLKMHANTKVYGETERCWKRLRGQWGTGDSCNEYNMYRETETGGD